MWKHVIWMSSDKPRNCTQELHQATVLSRGNEFNLRGVSLIHGYCLPDFGQTTFSCILQRSEASYLKQKVGLNQTLWVEPCETLWNQDSFIGGWRTLGWLPASEHFLLSKKWSSVAVQWGSSPGWRLRLSGCWQGSPATIGFKTAGFTYEVRRHSPW